MKRSKFSEQQIAFILRRAEEGAPVDKVSEYKVHLLVTFVLEDS